jgi:hypothetical protein
MTFDDLKAVVQRHVSDPAGVTEIMRAARNYAATEAVEAERFVTREFQDELAAEQRAAEGRFF